jgi:LAO/AO transport system kinase
VTLAAGPPGARTGCTFEQLADRCRSGDQRALARAITLVENRHPLASELISALYPQTGGAHVVGVTGPPGAGKSTLIGALIVQARLQHQAVGVLSVDPSSPLSQGHCSATGSE